LRESRAEFDAANEALATAKLEIGNLKQRMASLETAAVARRFSGDAGKPHL
jgi:BMFP domain-containing protein YqiC